LTQIVPEEAQTCFQLSVERVDGRFVPKVRVDEAAEQRLRASFGKTAIITDLSEEKLSEAERVEGFVAWSDIEEDWKWLKDRDVMSVKPVWVWSDISVPGHVFLCVMGLLLLLRYLEWELRELGPRDEGTPVGARRDQCGVGPDSRGSPTPRPGADRGGLGQRPLEARARPVHSVAGSSQAPGLTNQLWLHDP
jgi:hypothetical protein